MICYFVVTKNLIDSIFFESGSCKISVIIKVFIYEFNLKSNLQDKHATVVN